MAAEGMRNPASRLHTTRGTASLIGQHSGCAPIQVSDGEDVGWTGLGGSTAAPTRWGLVEAYNGTLASAAPAVGSMALLTATAKKAATQFLAHRLPEAVDSARHHALTDTPRDVTPW